MTGARHFVEHQANESVLFDMEGLGLVKVVVILRCAVFRESRGSNCANPKVTHEIALGVVQDWILKNPLKLPCLEDLAV